MSSTFSPFEQVNTRAPFCFKNGIETDAYCVVNPESNLLFCGDQTCASTSSVPVNPLFVNVNFWVIHSITDSNLASVTLSPGKVVFTAPGTRIDITDAKTDITTKKGKVIYQLKASFALK